MDRTDMTPPERLGVAAREALDHMPPELRAECFTLVELNAADAGVRVHYRQDDDEYDLVWVGRHLCTVPGWSARGEDAP